MDIDINDTVLWVFEGVVSAEREGDMLGFIVLRGPDSKTPSKLEAEYRFRWYNDKKIFGSEDDKSFWRVGPIDDTPESRTKLYDAFHKMFFTMCKSPWCEEVNGDTLKLYEIMWNGPLKTSAQTTLGGKDPYGAKA